MVVVQTGDAGYTNQPSIHAQARWRVRLESHARGQATGRAVDRMLLALRAYEQRAQRRAALHAWLLARGAPTSTTSPRPRPAAAVTTPDAELRHNMARSGHPRRHDRAVANASAQRMSARDDDRNRSRQSSHQLDVKDQTAWDRSSYGFLFSEGVSEDLCRYERKRRSCLQPKKRSSSSQRLILICMAPAASRQASRRRPPWGLGNLGL